MLTVTSAETGHPIEIVIKGKLTEEDYEEFQKWFHAVKQEERRVNLLVLVTGWEGMTLKAVAEDLKWLMRINEFHKMALVSDEKGMKAAEFFSSLLPGIKTKHFQHSDIPQARAWLAHENP